MSGYIWMLLWLLIYTALSAVLEVQQSETVFGVQTVRFTKLWATLGVLPLLIFCTLRGDIGDTYNYMHAFSEMPSTFSALPDYIQSLQKDHGFFLLSALIKLLCGGQVRVWFCILAALQLWPLVKNYRLYSESYCIHGLYFLDDERHAAFFGGGARVRLLSAFAAQEIRTSHAHHSTCRHTACLGTVRTTVCFSHTRKSMEPKNAFVSSAHCFGRAFHRPLHKHFGAAFAGNAVQKCRQRLERL